MTAPSAGSTRNGPGQSSGAGPRTRDRHHRTRSRARRDGLTDGIAPRNQDKHRQEREQLHIERLLSEVDPAAWRLGDPTIAKVALEEGSGHGGAPRSSSIDCNIMNGWVRLAGWAFLAYLLVST